MLYKDSVSSCCSSCVQLTFYKETLVLLHLSLQFILDMALGEYIHTIHNYDYCNIFSVTIT